MSEQKNIHENNVEILEQESRELDQKISMAKAQKKRQGFLIGELERQRKIKKTIETMESQGRLEADEIPADVQMISYRKQAPAGAVQTPQGQAMDNKKPAKGITEPINIAIIALSAIIIICALGSWLSVAGYDLNLKSLIDGLNTLSSWGAGSYVDQYKAMLWIMLVSIWIVGADYAWVIYQVAKGKGVKKQAIGGTVWCACVVAFLLFLSKYVSSQTYGWVNIEINTKAYVALALSVVVLIIGLKDNQQHTVATGISAAVGSDIKGVETEYLAANCYPWMNVQVLSGIMSQGTVSGFAAKYAYKGFPIDEITSVKLGSKITLLTDIVIITVNGISAVKNAELQIMHLEKEGRTEKIYLDANIGQVQSLKVFVKAVVVNDKEKVPACGFPVDMAASMVEQYIACKC